MASEESESYDIAEAPQTSRRVSLPEAESGEGGLSSNPSTTLASTDEHEPRRLGDTPSSPSKRRVSSTGGHDSSKRRRVSSGTSSSSAFATLKIIKPNLASQGETDTKYYVPSTLSSQTVNPLSSQTIGSLSSPILNNLLSSTTHVHGERNADPRLRQKATMDYLTPRLTEPSQLPPWRMDEVPGTGSFAKQSTSVDAADQYSSQKEDATVQNTVQEDEYPIDDDDEEDMLLLLNVMKPSFEPQFPPSSVANAWDNESRTVEEYDPKLQYSSVQSTPDSGVEAKQSQDQGETQGDLLDNDVDWDAVFTITSTIPKDDSLVGDRELEQRRKEAAAKDGTGEPSPEPLVGIPQERQLAPFKRPQFPAKVRDRPSVLGLSSRAVLRVCFRVEELISEATLCYHHEQDAVFELYARVTYSSRELLAKKQHFQFRDLFQDKQPFPSGTLSGWRSDSLLDQQSQVFLGTRTPQLCWILAKAHRDSKSPIGLTLEIISIRETDWDQIRLAKAIICGEEVEDEAGKTASTS